MKPVPHVCFVPDWQNDNPYQALLADALRRRGWNVSFADMPRGVFALNCFSATARKVDVLHLHWVNQLIGHACWSGRPWLRWLRRNLLRLDVWVLRARGVRVVWTVHNLVSHES